MKVGVNILNYGAGAGPEDFEAWVRHAEDLGFHLAMISDHVTLPPEVAASYPPPFYDPFLTLSWLAGRTTRIELGTTVAVLPYRHPLQTARLTAGLDRFSDGRLVLGVGLGWSRQEYEALGLDFDARGRTMDHCLEVIKEHWAQPELTLPDGAGTVATGPAPVRRPHPPIWVGGLSRPALRRAARHGDAWHPYGLGAEELRARLPLLEEEAERAGRPVPELAPRISLHLTERPVPDEKRSAGHGSLDQVRADLAALAELEVPYVVLDPFLPVFLGLIDAEECRRHDVRQLDTVAEQLIDLKQGTLL